MATQSPFSKLESFLQNFPSPDFRPPLWAVDEVQRRIVSLLNHILIQEREATSRLARQQGRVVLMQWRLFAMKLIATPAGLLDRAPNEARPDLVLALTEESPSALVQVVMRGDRPAVRIEGDVQLAAEVNWLVDHVRWDIEEDLSRVLGDAPAHGLSQAVRVMVSALRQFIGATVATDSTKAPT
jgi:ubiquinone biosynthesis protein UbiJ